ncbi:YARHG domain-containing protein [Cytophagaceae bacterium ABcell3]|nr:YARHG domain-containing protein [Cytophagaceae bacterium ABcell3]
MKALFCLLSIIVLFSGCSESQTEHIAEEAGHVSEQTEVVRTNEEPEVQERYSASVNYENINPAIRPYIIKLDSLFDQTPYYINSEGEYFFYVCNGCYSRKEQDDKPLIQMGIINEAYDTILAPDYSKIYNPDATVKDYIEIEINGMKGLFNYKTHHVIEPQYEVIFPSDISGVLAFGKIGDKHYAIKEEGAELIDEDIPLYKMHGEKWAFDIRAPHIKYLYDSYHIIEGNGPNTGERVVITPSYIHQLGYAPEVITGINQAQNEFGVGSAEGKIIESLSITDKIVALISSFKESGIDGRDYWNNKHHLITVDDKNNVLGSELFNENRGYGQFLCEEGEGAFKFLEDNMLETRSAAYVKEAYPHYDYMSQYHYYQILQDGEIVKLESNRFYEFTKYIKLDESYFLGCFAKKNSDQETQDEGNYWLYNHLTIEDLDIMRNEIFADYGLRFQTEKWQQYFNKQEWYAPAYDNVDHLLTEIDKHNIQTILSVKEKISGKEAELKKLIFYVAAG